MKSSQPLVFEIKGNALDDGPGIRSVVFFKGCPLSCLWCHNPEGKKQEVEIAYDAEICIGCETCLNLCPEKALSKANPFFIDRAACSLCFRCEQACPSGALHRLGKLITVEEVVAIVLRDKPFYDTSGGGVTLSGGEPTLFVNFAAHLLKRLKAEHLHTLLETCGLFNLGVFERELYPWLDLIYFDIKLMASDAHIRFCGVPNKTILYNFERLAQRAHNGGAPVIPRIPLIPGITTTRENLQAAADFLGACGVRRVKLLPYHPLWHKKILMLGVQNCMDPSDALTDWLDRQTLVGCKSIFVQAGIDVL